MRMIWNQRMALGCWWIALNFIAGNSPAQPSCVNPPDGLVGWWPGEGNALDLTTNHDDGTAVGGVEYACGEVGQAFSFNGQMQYIEIPYNPASPLFNLTEHFTYSLWVNPNPGGFSTSGSGPLIIREQCGSTWPTAELWLDTSGSNALSVRLDLNYENGPTYSVFESPAVMPNGGWHHVAASYDQDDQSVSLYIDGAVVLNATYSQTLFLPSTPFFIGGAPMAYAGCSWDAFYAGLIDEPCVFNRALSAAEIAGIYTAGSAGMCQPPEPPVITAQPQSATNVFGGTARFNVAVTTFAPLSYQWRENGVDLTNDTNAALTLTSLLWTDEGSYDVVVSNFRSSRSRVGEF